MLHLFALEYFTSWILNVFFFSLTIKKFIYCIYRGHCNFNDFPAASYNKETQQLDVSCSGTWNNNKMIGGAARTPNRWKTTKWIEIQKIRDKSSWVHSLSETPVSAASDNQAGIKTQRAVSSWQMLQGHKHNPQTGVFFSPNLRTSSISLKCFSPSRRLHPVAFIWLLVEKQVLWLLHFCDI